MTPAQLIQLSKYLYGDRKKAGYVSSTSDRKFSGSAPALPPSETLLHLQLPVLCIALALLLVSLAVGPLSRL